MAIFTAWALWRESACLKRQLEDEVQAGRMSGDQYRTAGSALAQFGAATSALFQGRYACTIRFYQVCGELAHKKEQLARLGEEGGNRARIEQLQAELASLAPQAVV
jgi:hypothetical protein